MKIAKKSESKLMRFLAFILKPITPDFMRDFWTTWPFNETIYVPTKYDFDPDWGMPTWEKRHREVLEHESVHIEQAKRWTVPIFALMYLVFPMPILFAWGRWRIERDAYLTQLRASTDKAATIEWIVDTLWHSYAWTWPRAWMRRWFNNQAEKMR